MAEVEFPRILRDYTQEEAAIVSPAPNEAPQDRWRRIAATFIIDLERYTEAVLEHPNMAAHFNNLVTRRTKAMAAWSEYFQNKCISNGTMDERLDVLSPTVSYSGSEQPWKLIQIGAVDSAVANLPA